MMIEILYIKKKIINHSLKTCFIIYRRSVLCVQPLGGLNEEKSKGAWQTAGRRLLPVGEYTPSANFSMKSERERESVPLCGIGAKENIHFSNLIAFTLQRKRNFSTD